MGCPGGSDSKESAYNAGDPDLIPESGRFPWRRKRQPTPVLLPGESHGQRSLAGYSPWGSLLYIGWINNKVLLGSTGKYIQYPDKP